MMVGSHRILGLLGVSIAFVACARQAAFERMSSGLVGCPPEQVHVTNIQRRYIGTTWTAECGGRQFACSGSARVTCSPMQADANDRAQLDPTSSGRESMTSMAATPGHSSKVRRSVDPETGVITVRAAFGLDQGAKLRLVAAPAAYPGIVRVALDGPKMMLEGCNTLEVRFNADRKPTEAVEVSVVSEHMLRMAASSPVEWYPRDRDALEVVGVRACERELTLDHNQRRRLDDFLADVRQIAAEQAATADGAPATPSTQL